MFFDRKTTMRRGQAPAPAIPMTALQKGVLQDIGRRYTTSQQLAKRIHL